MNCDCAYCKNDLSFDFPKEIIDAVIKKDLVVFAGAGISTENKTVFRTSFYEDIAYDLGLDPADTPDFPALMSIFIKQKNGRRILLEKIRERFEYCLQYRELYTVASKFHKELSSIYQIDTVFTTNWDDYFERECHAVPIVTAEDFAFYNLRARKVFKIHGSISNYGSIIATTEDYKQCYKNLREGVIGSTLKTMLATKTVVFIGYSFTDFDFNKIFNYLKKELKDFTPHYYIVTLDKRFSEKFQSDNVTIINTNGSFFLSSVRKHLEGEDHLLPKENLSRVIDLMQLVRESHFSSVKYYEKVRSTTSVYNLFYQDGILHALDYLLYQSYSGQTFNPSHIIGSIKSYKTIQKDLLKIKDYSTYSYVTGYLSGLYSMITQNIEYFPECFVMGFGPVENLKTLKKFIKESPIPHKTADKIGKRIFSKFLNPKSTIIPDHKPFID